MKRLLWLRLVLCVLLVPQLALGAQLPLVVQWMATAPLQLTWAQSTATEASSKPLPNFPHAPAVRSTRTRQGSLPLRLTYGEPVQLAQAELDKDELSGLLVLVAEQAGGWGLTKHTGLYDFGARQYDARQGQWLSPDPILVDYMQGRVNAGVYWPAQLGLYTFVANNPIKLVDPNGAEIILFGNAQEQRRVLGLLQKLISDRLALRGDRVIIQSLGPDQSPKSVGTLLLRRLRHSERNVTIMAVLGTKPLTESRAAAANLQAATAGRATDANVYLDERIGVTPVGVGKNGKVEAVEDAPSEITLAHELIHAESLMTGTADFNQAANSYIKQDGSQRTETQDQEEFSAVGISKPKPATENAIRREQGLRERQAVEPQ